MSDSRLVGCEEDGMSTVFLCPGQGSQKPGMGAELLALEDVARVFECASDVFGRDMAALVTEADAEAINDARAAQQAIVALTVATGSALIERGVSPDAIIGFSLGQMSALALSGMLSVEDTFALVDARSRIMAEVAKANPGAMCALLKATEEDARELCEECAQDDVLVPANFNSPGQIVISGSIAAIERAEKAWTERKKRCARLATKGAFHSPLMSDACAPMAAFLETLAFSEPRVPVICNTDAAPLNASSVAGRLVEHLTHPVLFEQSVRSLAQARARSYVECGFGSVLTNLVKRIDAGAPRLCVQDRESFDKALTCE